MKTTRVPVLARLQVWWSRLVCDHHWHASDAMIGWLCCWCGQDADGYPVDLTEACAHREARKAAGL